MLKTNLQVVLWQRNIANPRRFLINKAHISPETATNLLKGSIKSFRLSYMSSLCRLLDCTPNDLLEWVPSNGQNDLPPHHALRSLMSRDEEKRLAEAALSKIAKMSIDELRNWVQPEGEKEEE